MSILFCFQEEQKKKNISKLKRKIFQRTICNVPIYMTSGWVEEHKHTWTGLLLRVYFYDQLL